MPAYFIIALSDDHPDRAFYGDMYWCGYVAVGKTHSWVPGDAGFAEAIRFYDRTSAVQAGVSGPNTPYAQPQFQPNRGVKIIKVPQD